MLSSVPATGEFPITTLFELLLDEGRPVATFCFDDYWVDVGRPADLLQANGAA